METDVATLNREIERETLTLKRVEAELRRVIVGQDYLLDRLLVGLLARGHILIEGVPGLAKTLAVKTHGQTLAMDFQRIQFTPDLLPADLVGTLIYDQRSGDFLARRGPVFTHLLLADEINRAPAKVQSALLESMEERQVTLGDRSYHLPEPFMVLATQNPIEQEGTYPLAEAQVDRFMMKLKLTYPSRAGRGGDPRPHAGRRRPQGGGGARPRAPARPAPGGGHRLSRRQDPRLHPRPGAGDPRPARRRAPRPSRT